MEEKDKMTFGQWSLALPLAVIGTGILIGPALILTGFATKTLWAWFVTPIGVPAISLPQAIGIDLIVTLMTLRPRKEPLPLSKTLGAVYLAPIMALGIGYIVHLF